MRTNIYLTTLLASLLSLDGVAAHPSTCSQKPTIKSIERVRKDKFPHLTGSECGCTLLSHLLPKDTVHYPDTETYTAERSHYWTAPARLFPKCVFTPEKSSQVSLGVLVARVCEAEFNMRGAGHMPVVGAANTDGGILFAMSKFNRVELSKSKETVNVGPGNKWGDVYKYLAQYGLYTIGGRLSVVGVPGLILGGGINFFANKYGFSMDGVVSFEVVLADGRVVKATGDKENRYRDLFWALKGGSGQFGIVTNFELKTLEIPYVWTGMSMFATSGVEDPTYDTFYSAITNLTNSGYTDKGVGLISQIQYVNAGPGIPPQSAGLAVMMHEGEERNPKILREFDQIPWLDIPGRNIPANITSPVFISEAMANLEETNDSRYLFHVEASVATPEAVKTMHKVYFSLVDKLQNTVPSFTNVGVAIQGIPKSTIAIGKSDADKLTGNSFGLEQGKAQIWYCLSMGWLSGEDDAAAEAWATEFGEKLVKELRKNGQTPNNGRGFQYLNDAQGNQDVYSTYGPKELKKLKQIRERYDPKGKVFGKNGLVKGGFKF